jgi:hypothetical protein
MTMLSFLEIILDNAGTRMICSWSRNVPSLFCKFPYFLDQNEIETSQPVE